MRMLRGLGRWAGAVLWAVAVAPALALVAAAWLDRGPDGSARLTLFPAALTALDPYVWDCARNSLIVACAVTAAARIVGVGLARTGVRWRFWGRAPLLGLAGAVVVVPPAFAAIGLRALFGLPRTWTRTPLSWAWAVPFADWAALFWVELLVAAPLVALATARALARVDPVWEDAARLSGVSRRRLWRQVVWPVVRPDVARTLGLVFTLSILEPGAPLVLGLRRTLAYEVAESALDGGVGTLNRAVVLALAATAAAALARAAIGWWGGPELPSSVRDATPLLRPARASWRRGALFIGLGGLAAFLAWIPALGLCSAAFPDGLSWSFLSLVRDPLTSGYLANAAAVGLAALALDLVLARSLASWACSRRGGGLVDRLARWPSAMPPLAVGVGLLALPDLLRMMADALPASASRPSPAELIASAADSFDPDRTPRVGLIVAVALVGLPMLARSAVERRRSLRPILIDAAVSLGASAVEARRTSSRWSRWTPAEGFFTFSLAASNVVPALLFAPTADSRPLGPAVLNLIDEPGGFARASALALVAVVFNLAAFAGWRMSTRGKEFVRG